MVYDRKKNKAIKYYYLAAKQNICDAYNNLGCIYLEGIDVPKDIDKATFYFTHGAKQGNGLSLCNLGCL